MQIIFHYQIFLKYFCHLFDIEKKMLIDKHYCLFNNPIWVLSISGLGLQIPGLSRTCIGINFDLVQPAINVESLFKIR